ncbi:hypothetical protein [Ornithinimicrobium pekingense]|uniref:Uncharacterized protein n=1 Tax=Ornithinimicrobium pekingense TaxID=384677 RepID=A0ABQ2FAS7_9MICO|nr:hypothetical protein [Ornithinimicrobium pekingense]GGK77557.1 hypothetical protein GCM10011509_27620 [Ornithinimicrobium pekingense]
MPSWDGDPARDWAEVERALADRLQVLLPGLVSRRVPVRALEAGPVRGVGRLRLADGTTLLVSSFPPGGLARLMRALVDQRAVLVSSWVRDREGLLLTLGGVPGRQPVRLRVVGPDQPD